MSTLTNAPDLTKRAPRSPRVRLGGYVFLPRMLDKGRATIAGTNGDFHYACPLDQHVLEFTGIDAEQLKEQLALGKGDGEILEWITTNSTTKPKPWEIAQWSSYMENRSPGDVETQAWLTGEFAKLSKTREDLYSVCDYLDLDDHVSYGGKA